MGWAGRTVDSSCLWHGKYLCRKEISSFFHFSCAFLGYPSCVDLSENVFVPFYFFAFPGEGFELSSYGEDCTNWIESETLQ